ncbi:hypothetical protein [Clostridium sp. MD294]|uniref:hypothetical protein n=1 Tax=Clostridium sp. MD294 TaxID=97138 RepID=UPI0002CC8D0C|nr:hypothetical protein [Clostridium sp. MD294]NDO47649.1 hypothetical protein [Clostridium sp. MD294]USF30034.1 hypothetical protein C820_001457 [Clostridium sp. MD294]
MKVNKKYKDSLFTRLFSEEEQLRQLYNVLKGANYGTDTKIEVITLDDVLFMGRKNDICFKIDNQLVVLLEHQSTINENMPLRFLIYVAREYEKLIDNKALYKTTLIKIPTPEFYVLYNGVRKYPNEKILKLSEAFVTNTHDIKLELEVKVININYEQNHPFLQQCHRLQEYSYFIFEVKQNQKKGMSFECAVKSAIKSCVKQNIMAKFLQVNGSEVLNMLMTEFDIDVAREAWLEEGEQRGIKIGEQKGIKIGEQKGIKIGEQRGELKKQQEIAKKLIGILDIEVIAEKTGMSVEQVKKLL